jgi:hypothetical protein
MRHDLVPRRNTAAPELLLTCTDVGAEQPAVRTTPIGVVPYDAELRRAYVQVGTQINAGAAYWTLQIRAGATVLASVSSESAAIPVAGIELDLVEAEAYLAEGTALTAVWTPTGEAANQSANRFAITLSLTAGSAA